MSYVSPSKLQRALIRVKTEIGKKIDATKITNVETVSTAGMVTDARVAAKHRTEIDAIDTRVKTLETSFPGGCKVIANAVTSNGVTTAENASPSTIATNIGRIRSDGTATAAQILTGKTAWVNKAKVTGTMANRGGIVKTLAVGGSYTVPAGYHDGTGVVTNGVTSKGTLVLTAAQTGTKVDIVDGYYTHVNAKAVYDAGYSAGHAKGYEDGTKDADWEVMSNQTVAEMKNGVSRTLGTWNLTGYRYAIIHVTALRGTKYRWHGYDSVRFTVGSSSSVWNIAGTGTGEGGDTDVQNVTSQEFVAFTGGTNMSISVTRVAYASKEEYEKPDLRIDYIRLVK